MPDFCSGLITHFFVLIPVVMVALAATLAMMRSKGVRTLQMQSLGSVAYIVLYVMAWVFSLLIAWLFRSNASLQAWVNDVFGFLEFVALAIFSAGYAMEKLRHREVTAELVQDPK